jgi:hypothetical protein
MVLFALKDKERRLIRGNRLGLQGQEVRREHGKPVELVRKIDVPRMELFVDSERVAHPMTTF